MVAPPTGRAQGARLGVHRAYRRRARCRYRQLPALRHRDRHGALPVPERRRRGLPVAQRSSTPAPTPPRSRSTSTRATASPTCTSSPRSWAASSPSPAGASLTATPPTRTSRTRRHVDESDGLVDVVRSVAGSEIALFLKEVPGGKVRGNLRSKGEHDISGVARALGGGGHRAASGFTCDGSMRSLPCSPSSSLVAQALGSRRRGRRGER